MLTPFSAALFITRCPAVTRVSLLASAISLPASIAASVGRTPIIPTIAVTTVSLFSQRATATSPSIPETIFTFTSASLSRSFSASSSRLTAAREGLNSLICSSSSSILLPQLRASTVKSGFSLTTSSV